MEDIIEQQTLIDKELKQEVLIGIDFGYADSMAVEALVISPNFKMTAARKPTFWERVKAFFAGARLPKYVVL